LPLHLKKRLQDAYMGLKGYGASFYKDDNISYNRNSSELIDKLLSAVTGTTGDRNMIELFGCVPEIFTPVHAIAFRVASGNFQVKRLEDDAIVTSNKDLNKLLANPNPLQNFQELTYEAMVYEMITGKNFLYSNVPDTLSFNYKNIAALWNLWSQKVTIQARLTHGNIKLLTATQITDLVQDYKLEGHSEPIKPEKILFTHVLSLDAQDNKLNAKSPLHSAQKAIANLIAVYEARNVIYTKRGALGVLVSKKSDESGSVSLTSKEKDDLLKELQDKYGLKRSKSLLAVSDAPIDFIRVAMSIAELEPFKETQADALAIAGVLGVDKDLLPLPDGTTFENKKHAERSLYQNVSIPKAKSWAQSLTTFFRLNEVGLYIDVSFDHIEALQENKKEKSEVFKNNVDSNTKLYEKGVITKNQFLIGCGLQPLDGNGDVFITDVKNDTPLAVRLGVGGTQALQSILSDNNLSEDQKRNVLVILFGIPEDQARVMSVGNGANANNNNSSNQNNNDAAAA
jgi:phage portal protein BeeE